MEKFDADLENLVSSITRDLNEQTASEVRALRDRLIHLHNLKLVKINHSVMELLCAKNMILEDYEVELEKDLGGDLSCDLYGRKGDSTTIVEVETGFVPPDHALDPATYNLTRVASKIARYSQYADKFALGSPPYNLLQIPKAFLKPPRDREPDEVNRIKDLCDRYYTNPPISLSEIGNARLHAIYVIDIDEETVRQVNQEDYLDRIISWNYLRP